MAFTIVYDEPQEAAWFRNLHPSLNSADEIPINEIDDPTLESGLLGYDRPDIILLRDGRPILVVEETVEVPSGHNVGQRFARLAAAAEHQVPCLYFGPYAAKKHGGDTAGPRFMNLRLFGALDAMSRVTGTALTTINWPVDNHYEVRRDAGKDIDVRRYVSTLLSFQHLPLSNLNSSMLASAIHLEMMTKREEFSNSVRRSAQYNSPPNSVEFLSPQAFRAAHNHDIASAGLTPTEIVLYNVGMNNIRCDPYTGMAMLYHYLYIAEHSNRSLVLWFPNITHSKWQEAARNHRLKAIRLFRHCAEAILFQDALVGNNNL